MADKPFIEKIYKLKETHLQTGLILMSKWPEEKREIPMGRYCHAPKRGSTNSMCFIFGDYGFGKTLTLYKIAEDYKNDPEILSVFIKMLSEDKTPKFGVDFIQRIFQKVPEKIYKKFDLRTDNLLQKYFPDAQRYLPILISGGPGWLEFLLWAANF